MNNKTNYYRKLDILRIVCAIAILFYHLGYMSGGYLAVCTFFVLSGYLGVITNLNKDNFSLKEYYLKKIKKIYIPLLIVTFISIAVVSSIPNTYWLNIKNETTSVLLGYNNFWQINANLDYFARHIDSPFMHFWYIAILIQFDLLFPFIFMILNKLRKKFNKNLPIVITFVGSVIGAIIFYNMSKTNLMNAYYNTFTRVYSIFIGMKLGYIHNEYGNLFTLDVTNIRLKNIIYILYLIVIIIMFKFVPATSIYFSISMILINIVSCRCIDYSVSYNNESKFDHLIRGVANMTYEIYLVQYPVIYAFQYLNINHVIKIPIIIVIVLLLSFLLHFALSSKKKHKNIKELLLILFIAGSLYGAIRYISAKSYEKEMEELRTQLAENEKEMQEKQKDYELKQQQEEKDWNKELEKLENPDNYEELVKALPITFVGDSVMLGAMSNITKMFPNSYFDAKESRALTTGVSILSNLKNSNKLGEVLVLHLGTNGDCGNNCKENIMNILSDKIVFWLNTTNNEKVNNSLNELATKYDNLHIINWHDLSLEHDDWFYYDGIHLPPTGRKEYTNIIYNAIFEVYKDKFKEKKQALVLDHQEELRNKMSFYGNDLLFYDFNELQNNYSDARFTVKLNYSYKDLKEDIEKTIDEKTLSNKIVFGFDNSTIISVKEYQDLIDLCKEREIYIISTVKPLNSLNSKNVYVINFYQEIQKHKDYLMADGIHLTEKGNQRLNELINEKLK